MPCKKKIGQYPPKEIDELDVEAILGRPLKSLGGRK